MTTNSTHEADPPPGPPADGEPPPADSHTGTPMRIILGYLCLIAGVAGVLLPIIPGIPFLLVAIRLLGMDHPLIRPLAGRIRQWRNAKETRNDT